MPFLCPRVRACWQRPLRVYSLCVFFVVVWCMWIGVGEQNPSHCVPRPNRAVLYQAHVSASVWVFRIYSMSANYLALGCGKC